MELVTGHLGYNHIDAGDLRAYNRGIFGSDNYILEGSDSASITPATTVTIPRFEMMLDGSHIRTDGTDSITFTSTSQGMYRKDYICITITNSSGVESVSISVVTGTASGTLAGASFPTITSTSSATIYPIYEVVVYQSTVQSINCIMKQMKSIDSYHNRTMPVSEGGTGVTSKSALLDYLGISANHGTITTVASASEVITSTTLAESISYVEVCRLTLPAGTYVITGTAVMNCTATYDDVSIEKQARLRLYNVTANSNVRTVALPYVGVREDAIFQAVEVVRLTSTATIALQAASLRSIHKIESGNATIRAVCVK